MVRLLMARRTTHQLGRNFLLMLGMLTLALPTVAEEARWYQIGVGALATSRYSAPVLELGLNFQNDADLFAVRLSEVPGVGKFLPCAWFGYSDCETHRGVGALSLLYGGSETGAMRLGNFAFGVGVAWGNDLDPTMNRRDDFITVGLAMETQVIFRPATWFHFGISAGLNVNPNVSFGAVNLFIPFGGV